MLLKHFRTTPSEISGILSGLGYDYSVLQYPTSRIDANILGRYLEFVVAKTANARIGLETGFLLPFVITGIFFNIFYRSKTVREIFENDEAFDPALNDVYSYAIREDASRFYFELSLRPEFERLYPVASRQWIEMQCGFFLQYAYSFTGRFLHPLEACSIYEREGEKDKLEEFLNCPVKFGQDRFVMIFDKKVLDLPIVSGNREILAVFEDYMNEIRLQETGPEQGLARKVRRHLMHSLVREGLSLKSVAERFYMSERNMQRRLKAEGTTYQKILDDLRMELSQKYLKEKIALPEIGSLLGFESQSAFNKFFKKHFGRQPSACKGDVSERLWT